MDTCNENNMIWMKWGIWMDLNGHEWNWNEDLINYPMNQTQDTKTLTMIEWT